MGGGEPQRQMAAPGVADDKRLRPAEPIEHHNRILNGLSDRMGAFQSRGLKPALLI